MTDATIPSVSTAAISPRPATRRPELDVLTTLIVFSLIFFHTLGIFTGYQGSSTQLKNQLATILLSLVVVSEFIWIMPVMMFVAGIAIYHSLKRRGAGQFVQERLLRLGIPFLTGLVLANPPQIYYALRLQERPARELPALLPALLEHPLLPAVLPLLPRARGSRADLQRDPPVVPDLSAGLHPAARTPVHLPGRPAGERVVQRVAGFLSQALCHLSVGHPHRPAGGVGGPHLAQRLVPLDLALYHRGRLPRRRR